MSENTTNQPTPITTQREADEKGLENLSKTGGQLQRGADGSLRLVHPLVQPPR